MREPLVDLLDRSLSFVEDVLAAVPAERRAAETPCPGFTAEAMAAHLIGGLEWFAALPVGGSTDPTAVPEPDLAGSPLAGSFRPVADLVRHNWTQDWLSETFPMPSGSVTGAGIAEYMVVEILGHGWDVAVATGQAARPAGDLAEAVLAIANDLGAEVLRAPGMMGAPVEVPAGAPPMDRLVAFLGRDPYAGTGAA